MSPKVYKKCYPSSPVLQLSSLILIFFVVMFLGIELGTGNSNRFGNIMANRKDKEIEINEKDQCANST